MTLTLIIERFICEHVPFALKMEVKLKGRCVELTKLNLTSTVNAIPDNFFNVPRRGIKKNPTLIKKPQTTLIISTTQMAKIVYQRLLETGQLLKLLKY